MAFIIRESSLKKLSWLFAIMFRKWRGRNAPSERDDHHYARNRNLLRVIVTIFGLLVWWWSNTLLLYLMVKDNWFDVVTVIMECMCPINELPELVSRHREYIIRIGMVNNCVYNFVRMFFFLLLCSLCGIFFR